MTNIKIGQLAKRTGVTIRTLHYYDEIGLLKPANSSEAGYRLYSKSDIIRLQQILSLQQLGFSLQNIHQCLDEQKIPLLDVLKMHSKKMQQQLMQLNQLCDRMDTVLNHIGDDNSVDIEIFLDLIKATTLIEKHYTPEQQETLKQRAEHMGPEGLKQTEEQWRDLIAAVKYEQSQNTPSDSSRMQDLANQWQTLIEAFTGADQGMLKSLNHYNQENPQTLQTHGFKMDNELMTYIGKALKMRQNH